ncbi:glycosyltransferase [Halomonas korlensis]|uniref:Zeaxanthin glucosyltransferase n=1 Tax=Halomonas korlensis TaxID=463301 RepID=A0A1I7IY31_9GAMM|nr:nucleotide disphospho-sugar-binding domain-containing protein [Halomonas korlensis]SFU77846.1 zeaxanthin glucosyltransferase [Halomonas korlensis]
MPRHIGIIAPPLPSHFRALQTLAEALVARGHRTTFIHQRDAARWLDTDSIGFHAVGHDSHPPGSLARTLRLAAQPGGPLGLRRLIADMSFTTDMLCRELPRALDALHIDALLCDQMEAAGGLVAEASGRPFVSVACALPVNREPGLPLPVMPFAYGRSQHFLQRYAASEGIYDFLMARHRRTVAHHARAFGLAPREGLHGCLSPHAQISQTVPGFELPRQHLPAHFYHVGPLRPARQEAWQPTPSLAYDKPVVFASLGTLQGHRFGLFRRIARACRRLDAQLLLAHCGGLDHRQEEILLNEGASQVADAFPQAAVVSRADVVITHGGLNTVMDALVARTPLLVLPIAFDQPGVAVRVQHAGVGLRASPRLDGHRTLSAILERLLTDTTFAAPLARLGEEIKAAGGVSRAADISLEAFKE